MVAKTETLKEKFEKWLDERVLVYESIPPLSPNHRLILTERIATLRWVRTSFRDLANEIKERS